MERIKDLLLDTHIVIWMATDPDRIPLPMLESIEAAARRHVSHVTALEVQLKNLKNPAAFPFSLEHLALAMKEFSCKELPLSYQDIKKLGEMEFLHSDPFDRLLMAQTANRNFMVATVDRDILRTGKRYKTFKVFSH